MNNLLQVTSWLSKAGGGLPPVIRALTAEYRQQQLDCVVAGIIDRGDRLDMFPPEWPVIVGAIRGPRSFGYSPDLARPLSQLVRKDSVIHMHGLWMYSGWLARKLADLAATVRIVSPHGMLEPWAMRNSGWKKRLAASGYENKNLRTASCLHALSVVEARTFRRYGLRNPIAIIPNGIGIPSNEKILNNEQQRASEVRKKKDQKVLLYLGRLHPKKGLINLLKAWAQVKRGRSSAHAEWILSIAGWDQSNHEKELQKLASELNILSSVDFLGPRFDEAKAKCYQDCDAFILPSFSEGLPVVVLEAWSYGKPVLMTRECNLPEGFSAHAALSMNPTINAISDGLVRLMELSDDERTTMGENGLALVKKRFNWTKIASEMTSVYEWLLGEGPKPNCVVLNNASIE